MRARERCRGSDGLIRKSPIRLPAASAGLAGLTAHQQRILREIATGASNKKIAADLVVSVQSVENATASALRALGIDGTDHEVNVRVMAPLTYLRLSTQGY